MNYKTDDNITTKNGNIEKVKLNIRQSKFMNTYWRKNYLVVLQLIFYQPIARYFTYQVERVSTEFQLQFCVPHPLLVCLPSRQMDKQHRSRIQLPSWRKFNLTLTVFTQVPQSIKLLLFSATTFLFASGSRSQYLLHVRR